MDLATGATNTLLPKLVELVIGEYKLQKGVKEEIKELEQELTSMTAALCKVAEQPPDQLEEQVKDWASDVRELSYDIEDKVDTFMLCGKEQGHTNPFSLNEGLIGKANDLYKKAKTNHQIHDVVKDIIEKVKKVAERCDRYKVDNIAASPAMVPVDPLLEGLGKTTLANSLLQEFKENFDCHIFVLISLNPDIMMIFKNILLQLNDKKCVNKDEPWEMKQLIDRIIELLKDRRYNINYTYSSSSFVNISFPF
ncbi:unnamed protein product [Miscanthus lutarioriparius]|uniref:Rx N-terminal domain-containing protein n=1 Tax=Miscanthus lutarioriparius TaxID=422564 RepID=A0A811NML2_9POAL|nr:unnamed protein product [Miscanthus lutarioriparius]